MISLTVNSYIEFQDLWDEDLRKKLERPQRTITVHPIVKNDLGDLNKARQNIAEPVFKCSK